MVSELNNNSIRYKELDALRGLAAIFVVFFHLSMGRDESRLGFNLGITGVDLFFIISGFVIFRSINNVSSTLEFVINRVTRLYPTYWICVTFTFLLQLVIAIYANNLKSISIIQYLGNLTMLQYFLKIPNIDGQYWTLLIEILFYVFMALLFSFKRLKNIVPIGILIIYFLALNDFIAGTNFSSAYSILKESFAFDYFPLFFVGILFYKIKTENENHLLYYILIIVSYTIQILPLDKGNFISHPEYVTMLSIYLFLFLLFVNGKLKFIISKPILFLGKISFALYLIHQYMVSEVLMPFLINSCHINYWFSCLITLPVVIVLATLITFLWGIPFQNKLTIYLKKIFGIGQDNPLLQIDSEPYYIKYLKDFYVKLKYVLIILPIIYAFFSFLYQYGYNTHYSKNSTPKVEEPNIEEK